MTRFADEQQKIIDNDMRTMPSETINEILTDMKPDEADRFLERLGRVRARDIYDRETSRDRDAK